ncbi:Csu type fimbrial protein [Limibacillus halophilus]|uniref:Spore coat protein U-like protein n=1 Tax=Limibacillus halophilus TaxID=1579333 RepID=A0A839SY85_9PROT|nr:spore coat U domain-containing protein [Limibacillus halophilus]MBB3066506.1 spore coat protein U-like protein [Limibacillus halophilus]
MKQNSSTAFSALFFVSALLASVMVLIGRSSAQSLTETKEVVFRIQVVEGCALGVGATDPTSLGLIDFGQVSDLSNPIDATGGAGAGGVVVTCTPGTAFTMAIDAGLNGPSTVDRKLLNADIGQTLDYQLYWDAGRTTVWGDTPGQSAVADGSEQVFPVHARLVTSVTLPAPGIYTDRVLVTVTF